MCTVFAVCANWPEAVHAERRILSPYVIDELLHGNFAPTQSIVLLSTRVERVLMSLLILDNIGALLREACLRTWKRPNFLFFTP